MHKITHPDYQLPEVMALGSFGVMDTGTTEPMKVSGVNTKTGERGHYVIKYCHANRMSEKASAHELLGAWLAHELDLPVVEPVLIQVEQSFANTFKGKPGYQAAVKSIGVNFGSKYAEGYQPLVHSPSMIPGNLEETALEIFAFDQFIYNADRRTDKPNVLSNGNEFLLLDHELAFSFSSLLSFARNKTPWVFGDFERETYIQHLFYPYLRKAAHNFHPFCDRLVRINDHFWERVDQFLPPSWRTDEIDEIQEYLQSIITNRNIFAEQLTSILLP